MAVSRDAVYVSSPLEEQAAPSPPSFVVRKPQYSYNLPGTPTARNRDNEEEIFTDPAHPSLYYESQLFSTPSGSYKNFVYRIHFEKVPFSLQEPHLTTGNNPGILILYTCDMDGKLLLVTTLGSCGCYLAFFPTDNLPPRAYPVNWPETTQHVYGYDLPARLTVGPPSSPAGISFTLESGSHRISSVSTGTSFPAPGAVETVAMQLRPMSALYHLTYGDGGRTTSFFKMEGARAGYVKNNLKILERLLISWWAFDLRVGEDKAYGKDDRTSVPLYTSLKFWQREASDLKDFPGFLSYWGWKF
jgi:hypothetical protein